MSKIILQPIGNKTKKDFFKDNPTSLTITKKYKDDWQINVNDTVLFIKNYIIFAVAIVENIQEECNGAVKNQLRYTWNGSILNIDIPLNNFNTLFDYPSNFTPKDIMLVKGENMEEVFSFLISHVYKIYNDDEDTLYQNDIQDIKLYSTKYLNDIPIKKQEKLLKKYEQLNYLKNPFLAKVALSKAKYKCELNESHFIFKAKFSNQNYVKAHHLIPLKYYEDFNYSLDVPANIVSLCPACHLMLQLGSEEDVNSALETLYKQRKERLDIVKLNISLSDLQLSYNLKIKG